MKKIFGFTLAEVLIVLGIIGIVAEMTIITTVQSFQKQVYLTQLKNSYVVFNQVLSQFSTENGSINDIASTGIFDPSVDQTTFGNAIVKYFKTNKNCKMAAGKCMTDSISNNFDGSGARYSIDGVDYEFITSDGVGYRLHSYQNNCDLNAAVGSTGNLTQLCAYVEIDVNGALTGPNNVGRDIFLFYLTNGKGPVLYPWCGKDMASYWRSIPNGCGNTANKGGSCCSGRIIEENWKMNY